MFVSYVIPARILIVGATKYKMSEHEPSEKTKKPKQGDVDPSKVHSANCWESADLGDDDRNKKFLRLMGASKKEHHGRFVIGDKEPLHPHQRKKQETDQVNRQLEEQYIHSQEHKITRYSHKGLGFEDPDTPKDKTVESSDDKASEKPSEHTDSSKCAEETGKKRDSVDKQSEEVSPPKKPKMMMNFVKASD